MALLLSPVVGPGKLGAQWGARAGAIGHGTNVRGSRQVRIVVLLVGLIAPLRKRCYFRRPTPDTRRPQRYYGVSRLAPLRPPLVGPGKLDAGQGASLRGVRQQVLPMSLGSLITPLLKWLYSRRPTPLYSGCGGLWAPLQAIQGNSVQSIYHTRCPPFCR